MRARADHKTGGNELKYISLLEQGQQRPRTLRQHAWFSTVPVKALPRS